MADRYRVMSEYCREERPLLCEEAPDEELYGPQYYRRIRVKNYRGRMRNNLQGAATILTRWPGHWSSFLTYLWIGLGMISLSTFIIYNSLFSFSLLPSVNLKPTNAIITNGNDKTLVNVLQLPDIYMHIFVSQTEDIDVNQYMPYVETIASTFLDYTFNFIVVINDTNIGWLSAEENNQIALNALWNNDKNIITKETRGHNINIEQITLSAILDSSPLRKYWRILPYQLIEFLVRAVSIWDKGGVAFNPNILTPKFQHTLYIEKLQTVLNNYAHTNKVIDIPKIVTSLNKTQKKHRQLNNIRDIIDALQTENMQSGAFSQQTLAEAENRDVMNTNHNRFINTAAEVINNSTDSNIEILNNKYYNIISTAGIEPTPTHENISINTIHIKSNDSLEVSPNNTKMSLLPLFFEFLFHNKADIKSESTDISVTKRTRKSAIIMPNSEENLSVENKSPEKINKIKTSHKPVIISAIDVFNKLKNDNFIKTASSKKPEEHETNRLGIDLKGNILSTITPCHAFLGTMFSNVIRHSEEENVTDFIIGELTIFCKGLLSTCIGIDLILL